MSSKPTSFLIRTNKIIGPIVIAGLGIFASLWTNCVFSILVQQNSYEKYYREIYNSKEHFYTIVQTVQYEYVLLCFIAIVTLLWGLVQCDKKFLYPWACLKFCENIVIVIGGYIILQDEQFILDGIIPLGIIALSINSYTSMCVYKAYKRMMIPLPPKELLITEENKNQETKIFLEENSKSLENETKEEDSKYIETNGRTADIPTIHCTLKI